MDILEINAEIPFRIPNAIRRESPHNEPDNEI
jgi:hypothetical protein